MIALGMIVKGTGDEPQRLERALGSILPWVDAAYITITGPKDQISETEKVLAAAQDKYLKRIEVSYEHDKSRYTVTQEQVDWLKEWFGWEPESKMGDSIFLFDVARNFNLDQIDKDKYHWMVWLDCDDIFRGGDKLKSVVEEAEKNQIEVVYFNYIYQAEIENNQIKYVIIEHLRERIVRTDGSTRWVAPIHETLIEQRPTRKKDFTECDVLHLAENEKRMGSLHRNIKTLEYSIFKDQGKDPRPIYYLAKAYFDLRTKETDERARKLIYLYLRGENRSGWPEERAQACEYLCEIYRRNGENQNALIECMNGLMEQESPTLFLSIASTYMIKGEWERALMWAKIATNMEGKKTTLVINPKDMQAKILEILYNCHLNLNHIDEAWAAAVKLVELFPNDEQMINAFKFIEGLKQERNVTKAVADLANYLYKSGEPAKVKALLAAVPAIATNNPITMELYKKNNPPKYWEDNEIAIYCGPGFTNWSPKQLINPKGSFVGGSEEAVILQAKELTKLGWSVTVYNDPGVDEGIHGGVNYLPYYKFNKLDHFNILIAWRQPEFIFQQDLNYKKSYIWCHDILNPLQFPKDQLNKVDKIIVQSPWHRENIKDIPDDKILISSNGIV